MIQFNALIDDFAFYIFRTDTDANRGALDFLFSFLDRFGYIRTTIYLFILSYMFLCRRRHSLGVSFILYETLASADAS